MCRPCKSPNARVPPMAISYEIDKERRIVLCTASDVCTAQDALSLHEQIQSDPAFDPSFSQLMDFTPAVQGDIAANEVRTLAGSGPFSLASRRAFVTNSLLGFGFSRMFQLVSGSRGQRVRVFRDRDEALAWLQSEKDPQPATRSMHTLGRTASQARAPALQGLVIAFLLLFPLLQLEVQRSRGPGVDRGVFALGHTPAGGDGYRVRANRNPVGVIAAAGVGCGVDCSTD